MTGKDSLAYPFEWMLGGVTAYDLGLTKRELFAAMAMQGLSANSLYQLTPAEYAWEAVKQADALIEALNETKEKP